MVRILLALAASLSLAALAAAACGPARATPVRNAIGALREHRLERVHQRGAGCVGRVGGCHGAAAGCTGFVVPVIPLPMPVPDPKKKNEPQFQETTLFETGPGVLGTRPSTFPLVPFKK